MGRDLVGRVGGGGGGHEEGGAIDAKEEPLPRIPLRLSEPQEALHHRGTLTATQQVLEEMEMQTQSIK